MLGSRPSGSWCFASLPPRCIRPPANLTSFDSKTSAIQCRGFLGWAHPHASGRGRHGGMRGRHLEDIPRPRPIGQAEPTLPTCAVLCCTVLYSYRPYTCVVPSSRTFVAHHSFNHSSQTPPRSLALDLAWSPHPSPGRGPSLWLIQSSLIIIITESSYACCCYLLLLPPLRLRPWLRLMSWPCGRLQVVVRRICGGTSLFNPINTGTSTTGCT